MHIRAVNTLEIRFVETPDLRCIERLDEFINQFKNEPECLGVSLEQGVQDSNLWILCAYWNNDSAMTTHFVSSPMIGLVNLLVRMCAHLTFASFAPVLGGTSQDGV
ncbi:antibiotic biosynthesis monooxygenase [Pseudomonas syringae]|uniref:Transposase n=1 Tax=Pseudomonas syringae pv. daphniphylli TaxID=264455 RepID=A0A9X0H4D1_PSESX|nr:antibiotic biosynthesis monooxygenase [Pseudomonas syringae]KPX12835.1 hypothetical protein ALO73_200003 [Pseudomonas syringae pv. daphniphylli]KWS87848.1 hypothetical protein AL050_23230 [Pseudomonas syringae pv. daphniphylli]